MRVVIIENELDAQELLHSLLTNFISGVDIVGTAATVTKGKSLIESTNPELVFLDIHLDDGTGFDLLDLCPDLNFKVIFTTAYEDHALEAFKYNTVDYLLKPYGVTDLQSAIDKIKKLERETSVSQLKELLSQAVVGQDKKIAMYTSEGIWMVEVDNIVRFEGEGSYTYLYDVSGKRTLLTKSLGEVEKMLPENRFYRSHKSHIVSKKHIEKYIKEDGGYILMSNGDRASLSRRKKEDFVQYLLS